MARLDSFGDHERRDVLGAVRWLRDNHPIAGRRLVALGVDTGAAALLAAADDPSPEGRAFDALAVFGCYDRFDKLAAGAALPPLLRWLVGPVGLPMACIQTGADLSDFSPARAAADLAPRPILFVHGLRDPVVTFERGLELYHAAAAPKGHIWLEDLTDEQAVDRSRHRPANPIFPRLRKPDVMKVHDRLLERFPTAKRQTLKRMVQSRRVMINGIPARRLDQTIKHDDRVTISPAAKSDRSSAPPAVCHHP